MNIRKYQQSNIEELNSAYIARQQFLKKKKEIDTKIKQTNDLIIYKIEKSFESLAKQKQIQLRLVLYPEINTIKVFVPTTTDTTIYVEMLKNNKNFTHEDIQNIYFSLCVSTVIYNSFSNICSDYEHVISMVQSDISRYRTFCGLIPKYNNNSKFFSKQVYCSIVSKTAYFK